MWRSVFIIIAILHGGLTLAQEGTPATFEMNVPAATQFNYDSFSGLPSSADFTVQVNVVAGTPESDEVNALGDDDDAAEVTSDEAESDDQVQTTENDLDPAEVPQVVTQLQPQSAILVIVPANNDRFILRGGDLELPLELSASNQSSIRPAGLGFEYPIVVDAAQSPGTEVLFGLNIPQSVYASPRVYNLELEISLVDPVTREVLVSPKSTLISVTVAQKLQTNIAGTLGRYEDGVDFSVIDFEELQTGESRRVFIQVRGNTEATITVSSENDGRMVNLENSNFFVDYSVNVDGVASSLETPLQLDRNVAQDLQGSAYPMTVTIGNVARSFSGDYQDVITVDVTPQ